jgi:hypothetical protein
MALDFWQGCAAGTQTSQDVTDQRRSKTVSKLLFFVRANVPRLGQEVCNFRWIYRIEAGPAEWCGRVASAEGTARPGLPYAGSMRRSGCVPAEPYSPLKRHKTIRPQSKDKGWKSKSPFDRTSPFANYEVAPFADTVVSF